MVISNMANNLDIKIIKELENEKFDNTNDLFEHRKVHIFNIVGTKTIEEILSKDFSKIIITDYKNYKKYLKKYEVINGYEFESDLKYYLEDCLNIMNEDIFNY